MKPSKLALFAGLGLAIALLNAGCAPAHQDLAERYLDLPYTEVNLFKIQHPGASDDAMSDLRDAVTRCYTDAAKKLGDQRDWKDAGAAVTKAKQATAGKTYDSIWSVMAGRLEVWLPMAMGRDGADLRAGAQVINDWTDAAGPCVDQATKAAAATLKG